MNVDSLPERPLYLHEVRVIQEGSDKVNNAEALFYEGNNLNAVICLFINVNDTGHILGFDAKEESWIQLADVLSDTGPEEYDSETDSIIEWVQDQYGEEFGVYGIAEE